MSFFNNLSQLFGQQEQDAKKSQLPRKHSEKNKQRKARPKKQSQKRADRPSQKQRKSQRPAGNTATLTNELREAKAKAQELVLDAQAKARETIVEAKAQALSIRSEAETEKQKVIKEIEAQQRSLNEKLDKIEQRLLDITKKEDRLESENDRVQKLGQKLEETRAKVLKKLESLSGFTKEEAKKLLFEGLEKKYAKEMAVFVRQKQEEAQIEADEKVQEILVDAMKHGATDYVAEYTVSIVKLPSEETKGKIIGKSGRNINAFERATGVDVDLDMSPTEVRLSCFDPVRREIARIALERLIKDGRIQPTRIEETVKKVTKEFEKILLDAGKKLCQDVGVYNLHPDLMRMLGRFKYRFSYGQNLIAHTLEETKIGIKIAHELGVDVNTVKLGCLLHDIGKVSKEEEGSHVELGVKIAKQYGLPQGVIDCIAQHHEDEPFSGPEQMVVYIADAISGARPGARYENYDEYVQRLQKLEEIATAYDEVSSAYAIQAGREIRVLLNPEHSKDDDVTVLSTKIRDEIKESMTYPGTVTVTVVREMRSQAVAK